MKNLERNKKIVELRKEKKTLSVIGKIFGITRERVRQICAIEGCFVARSKKPLLDKKCILCKKEFKTKIELAKFCSKGCAGLAKRVVKDEDWKKQKRIKNNIRCKAYYHNVLKHSPNFHELISKRNKKYSLNRKKKLANKKDGGN